MYLRQRWLDPRLTFDPAANRNKQTIRLEEMDRRRLWMPEVVFRNEKQAIFHSVTRSNIFMRLYNTGVLWDVVK